MLAVALALGFGIGGSLGLLGGGGSILTVPALVYLVGQPPHVAVTTSLAIVGMNSALGAFFHRTQGTLNWHVALLFGGTGMLTSYLAAGISKRFSPDVLMVAFAALMLVIGVMLIRQRFAKGKHIEAPSQPSLLKIALTGMGVGVITGILGVGGGFLIVPALVMVVGLPFHQAVGTSLVVIAMNSLAGFVGHLEGATLDASLMAVFIAAGLAGTFTGTRLAKRMNPAALRSIFALFVIALALFLLVDNLPKVL